MFNHRFTNTNYTKTIDMVPLSYAQQERAFSRQNSQNVSNITREVE